MQRDNSVYWKDKDERAKEAVSHTERMSMQYPDEIRRCIERTKVYEGKLSEDKMQIGTPGVEIYPEDSVTSVLNRKSGKTCVLNFASFKEPGGLFLKGSKAQEECLCHESFLYNVLREHGDYYESNKTNLNRGLYRNRALYSPNILFERDGTTVKADVVTCAAPNFYTANKYCGVSTDENSQALRSRIRFLLKVLRAEGVETAILGAWGAGVFCQDASEVAQIFNKEIESIMCGCKFNAIFAVPDGRDGNYQKMKAVFDKPTKTQGKFLGAKIQEWIPPKTIVCQEEQMSIENF